MCPEFLDSDYPVPQMIVDLYHKYHNQADDFYEAAKLSVSTIQQGYGKLWQQHKYLEYIPEQHRSKELYDLLAACFRFPKTQGLSLNSIV